ncbi:MAG TPA: C4-dicarboxylate ABC transporter [Candidatus Limnocylindria bacterium]|nr:C4-dicarboxylate ABC transporter [Candidatus Limnocylindria bacterium]
MERVLRAFAAAGPAWFTSVMGTGILGIGIVASPVSFPGQATLGTLVWGAAAVVFAVIVPLLVLRAILKPAALLATFRDPATAQVWGAPPMAAFTLAVGLMRIVAPHADAAVRPAQALWVLGVVGSLIVVSVVPYLMVTRYELVLERALGTWLLPVVPPIVASVPAALLLPTFPASMRSSILAIAFALLGIGLVLAAAFIVVFFSRLLFHKTPRGALAPSMWLVVGPLGQSIAGFSALGGAAVGVWPAVGHMLSAAALAYGVLVWGFAVYWLGLAVVTTLAAARAGMPFTLGWWSFTFPVGVLLAGTDALWAATGAPLFAVAALVLLGLLVTTWTLVAARTAHAILRTLRAETRPSAPELPHAA